MKDCEEAMGSVEPFDRIIPRRKITGMSAILLPFLSDGGVDWGGFFGNGVRAFAKKELEKNVQTWLVVIFNWGSLIPGKAKR